MRQCECPTRVFVPGPNGTCYRCGGLAPKRCDTCLRPLTDSELAGGVCQGCGQPIDRRTGSMA